MFASVFQGEQRQALQQVLFQYLALNQDLVVLGNQAYVTHVRSFANSVALSVKAEVYVYGRSYVTL